MNKHTLIAGLSAAIALAATMSHADAQPMATASGAGMNPMTAGAMGAADRKFIDNAAIGGMAEVAAGKMAQDKAASDAVKQFGAHMVQDHEKANGELAQLAAAKGVTPPTTLDKSHRLVAERLAKLSGAGFDREYMKAMLADHKTTITLFQKEASSGSNADVKAWAAKTLPTLQDHLQLAQTQYDAVSGGSGKTAAK